MFNLTIFAALLNGCVPFRCLIICHSVNRLKLGNLVEGLPGRLPIGQVTLKSYLPDHTIYLSWMTGRDFCQAQLVKSMCT